MDNSADRSRPSFDTAEELPSQFNLPRLSPSIASLEAHFASEVGRSRSQIRNYHGEIPVAEEDQRSATPAAVLVPVIDRPEGPSLLFTRRHHSISYPEHVCFPGGRRDPDDRDADATALREAHEEIDLEPSRVRILGRLGEYFTQSRFRITPVVAVVVPPLDLTPNPGEVTEILEIPFDVVTDPNSYRLFRPSPDRPDAYYSLSHGETMLTGPTVCLAMGLYEALTKTHPPVRREIPGHR